MDIKNLLIKQIKKLSKCEYQNGYDKAATLFYFSLYNIDIYLKEFKKLDKKLK